MKVIIQEQEFELSKLQTLKDQLSISLIHENHWHILHKNQSITLRLVSKNHDEQTAEWLINGKPVSSKYLSDLDLLLQSMGMHSASRHKIQDLKSPMPGLIKKILVKEGESVTKGQALLTLEAMKMENLLKASSDAKIAQIKVKEGSTVEKNQVLIVLE